MAVQAFPYYASEFFTLCRERNGVYDELYSLGKQASGITKSEPDPGIAFCHIKAYGSLTLPPNLAGSTWDI